KVGARPDPDGRANSEDFGTLTRRRSSSWNFSFFPFPRLFKMNAAVPGRFALPLVRHGSGVLFQRRTNAVRVFSSSASTAPALRNACHEMESARTAHRSD